MDFLETVFFFKELFPRSGNRHHVLTNVIDFLASGNHFFPIFSVSGQLLLVEVFPSTGTHFSANFSFWPVEISFLPAGNSDVLFRVFFC